MAVTLLKHALRVLKNLPPSIAELDELRELFVNYTQISDITSIAKLNQLQMLFLDNTQIDNIEPIAALDKLRRLDLDYTQVSNIVPIAELDKLQTLDLTNTRVSDLSPVCRISSLAKASKDRQLQFFYIHGLHYADTPAAERPIFRDLVKLDQPERTIQTLQYLNGTHPIYGGPPPAPSTLPPNRSTLLTNPPAEPITRLGTVDLDPAPPGDETEHAEDQELATLPRRQQNLADQIRGSLGQNQPTTRRALAQYREELNRPQTEIILEILKEAYLTAKAGIEQARQEGALDDDALAAWDQFDANHGLYLAHFPFDATRERLYRDAPVDMDTADPATVAKAFADFLDVLEKDEVAEIVGPRLHDWAENSARFSQVIADMALASAMRGDIPDEDMPHRVWLRRQVAQGWVMMVKIDALLETGEGKVIKNVTEFLAAVAGLAAILNAMFK